MWLLTFLKQLHSWQGCKGCKDECDELNDVPIFIKGPPCPYKRRGASVPHLVVCGQGGRLRKQGQGITWASFKNSSTLNGLVIVFTKAINCGGIHAINKNIFQNIKQYQNKLLHRDKVFSRLGIHRDRSIVWFNIKEKEIDAPKNVDPAMKVVCWHERWRKNTEGIFLTFPMHLNTFGFSLFIR